jgi:hypothetical protein
LIRSTDSEFVRSVIQIDAPDADLKAISFIVFDLVLYKGHWIKNVKHGDCKHFLTYRNYYVPKVSTDTPTHSSPKPEFVDFAGSARLRSKYDYPGHTTVEAILKEAQLLSGCFFSGHWENDLLSRGSLFYFHRLFCLRFNGKKQSNWLDCERRVHDDPDFKVMYFDCRTASHFSVKWEEQKDVEHGIWNMGCVVSAKRRAKAEKVEKDKKDEKDEKPQLRRLPDLTRKIRSTIVFNESSEHSDAFIDVKDG